MQFPHGNLPHSHLYLGVLSLGCVSLQAVAGGSWISPLNGVFHTSNIIDT